MVIETPELTARPASPTIEASSGPASTPTEVKDPPAPPTPDLGTSAAVAREATRSGRVIVLGSLNCDHTVWVDRLPEPGETVLADARTSTLGGKGFNQAVTAARQGAEVVMVGSVGDDSEGDRLVDTLADEGVDTRFLRRHAELPTGQAWITVDRGGENTIAVVPGANLGVEFPSAAVAANDVLLAQLEVPLDVVVAALAGAREVGAITVLNPAPALRLDPTVLALVDYLVPNEQEADVVGVAEGSPSHGTVIITMGADGALVRREARERRLPAVAIPVVVDPTAAGDAFCGTLAAGLASGRSLGEALGRAAAAGAHAVTVAGALPALPYADEVDALLSAGEGHASA
jgi:ribokinase